VSKAVYLADALDTDVVVLAGPEGHHAATVRRTRVGEVVDLVDGRGTRCTGAVTEVVRDSITVQVVARVREPAPAPRITVVQALAKGERSELAVEVATEVGADVVVPWQAARSVVRWEGERGRRALERWRSTAREAAKQARRSWFPTVLDPVATAQIPSLGGQLLVLHEAATVPLTSVPLAGSRRVGPHGDSPAPGSTAAPDQAQLAPAGARDIVLVVGPEGGITDDELAVLTADGGVAVRLGETVLRTSTAGAAALAVVSARIGRW
jgi:16S rRNA (uracil1498-N3)-methyltransferase